MFKYVCICNFAHIDLCVYADVYVRAYMLAYMCRCAMVHVSTHVHTHMHAHTHIQGHIVACMCIHILYVHVHMGGTHAYNDLYKHGTC